MCGDRLTDTYAISRCKQTRHQLKAFVFILLIKTQRKHTTKSITRIHVSDVIEILRLITRTNVKLSSDEKNIKRERIMKACYLNDVGNFSVD